MNLDLILIESSKAAVAAGIGISSYLIKEWLTRGKNAKYSARLISMDMYNALAIINESEKEGTGFPPHRLTLLDNWKKEFYNVHQLLSLEQATKLMEYYRQTEHLEDLRRKMEQYHSQLEDDNSFTDFQAKQVENVSNEFHRIARGLIVQDYKDLIDKLKKLS